MTQCPVCRGDKSLLAIDFALSGGTAVRVPCPVCHGEGELPDDSMHFETPERNARLEEQKRRMEQ